MFAGEFSHALDAKNRIVVPRRLLACVSKKTDSKNWLLTLGVDGCLFLFTFSQFRKIEGDLSPFLFGNQNARRFQRLFFSHVHPVEPDGQSRIMIPDSLKNLAGIKKNVVFVGCGNRIEVWADETWQGFKNQHLAGFDALADVICGTPIRPDQEKQ